MRPTPATVPTSSPKGEGNGIGRGGNVAFHWAVWGCVMDGESERRRARASSALREHLFLKSRLSPLGRAAIALWPDNAPKIIAGRAGITVRNANQIMRGQRKVTAKVLLVINAELLS